MREPADGAENFLHGRGLAQDVGRFREDLFRSGLALTLGHGAANQVERLGNVERLRQILKRTALERLHRRVQVRERGHHDDGQGRTPRFDAGEHLYPAFSRHAHVRQNRLRRATPRGERDFESGERLAGVGKHPYRKSFLPERPFEHPANGLIVVDNPN